MTRKGGGRGSRGPWPCSLSARYLQILWISTLYRHLHVGILISNSYKRLTLFCNGLTLFFGCFRCVRDSTPLSGRARCEAAGCRCDGCAHFQRGNLFAFGYRTRIPSTRTHPGSHFSVPPLVITWARTYTRSEVVRPYGMVRSAVLTQTRPPSP